MLLQDVFEWQVLQDPDAEVARDVGGRIMTRADLEREANQIAAAFLDAGLARGDRVALLAKNCLEYVAFYLGSAKAGIVLVPLNYRLAPAEWAYIIENADTRLIVARGEFVEPIESIRDQLGEVATFVALDADTPNGWLDYREWVDAGAETPTVDVGDDDIVIQMYTSGTTGLPKGVMLTHGAVTSNLVQIAVVNISMANKRMQVVAPLYHVGATISALATLTTGGTLFVHEDFIPDEVARALDEEKIAITFLVPAMIQALELFVPGIEEMEFADLEIISYGASPITEETLRNAMKLFGCEFAQGFGQTEATAMLTYLSPQDHARALSGDKPELLRSAGRAGPGTRVRIIDSEGEDVPAGEVGEIIAKGPQLMKGYHKRDDATAETIVDGWLRTGDAGYLDDEGYLYISDRIKDMIISGGENVYPAEIEQVLFSHDAVADAAVIGIPSEKWGETVHAFVQAKPASTVTAEEIIDFCAQRLARYKRPQSVEFIDEIPRNASMKVLKRELRKPYWEGQSRGVG